MKRSYKGGRKGVPNKETVMFNDIKKDVIKEGIRANSDRLEHLKDNKPYTYLRTVKKLLSL